MSYENLVYDDDNYDSEPKIVTMCNVRYLLYRIELEEYGFKI